MSMAESHSHDQWEVVTQPSFKHFHGKPLQTRRRQISLELQVVVVVDLRICKDGATWIRW
jgi:hypothetical protein